jgi:hypothetical protein
MLIVLCAYICHIISCEARARSSSALKAARKWQLNFGKFLYTLYIFYILDVVFFKGVQLI